MYTVQCVINKVICALCVYNISSSITRTSHCRVTFKQQLSHLYNNSLLYLLYLTIFAIFNSLHQVTTSSELCSDCYKYRPTLGPTNLGHNKFGYHNFGYHNFSHKFCKFLVYNNAISVTFFDFLRPFPFPIPFMSFFHFFS